MDQIGIATKEAEGEAVSIELRKLAPAQQFSEEAKALWDQKDQELLVKEIAIELSRRHGETIGRNLVAKAIKFWFTSRGLPAPDGRSRRSTLNRKSQDPFLYQAVADRVMELWNEGRLLEEIAQELRIDPNTVTASVRYWHERRGLPVPDGRTRRKNLQRKSRSKAKNPA